MADDRDIWLAPIMTGIPAVVSKAEGALSTLPDDFSGLMVGAQMVPGFGPVLVVGALNKSGEFMGGATSREHWGRFRDLVNATVDQLDAGAFDQAAVAQ